MVKPPRAPWQVAILGNCKRFDVYVALARPVEAEEVGRHVAEAICQQMAWHHEMAGHGESWDDGMMG